MRLALVAVAVSGACGDDAPTTAAGEPIRFDLDVEVHSTFMRVWFREGFDTGCIRPIFFP